MESYAFPSSGSFQPTICLVDDDESILKSMSRLLQSTNYNVHAFNNAKDFMQFNEMQETDCIVLDVRMPGITGLDLHQWLISKGMLQPVLFLTAHIDIPASVKAIKHGATDFLVKPIDEKEFLDAINMAIQEFAVIKAVRQFRQHICNRYTLLTSREKEVMTHVIQGRLNKQIAWDLNISLKTVKVHRARAMEKMEAHSVAELVHFCEVADLLPPPPTRLN